MAQTGGKTTKVLLYKDRLAAQWDTVNCVKNVLKINPLLFLRGEIPLYYERALSHRLSAEIAVGVTFRNYLGGGFTGDGRIRVATELLKSDGRYGCQGEAVLQMGWPATLPDVAAV